MARKSNSNLFAALLYIVIGALLIIFRNEMLQWAMTIAGIFFVVSGVLEFLKNHLISGIVSLIIGIAILVLGWTIASIVLLVLGILIGIKGIVGLIAILSKKRKNIFDILFPIITIAVGAVVAFGNALGYIVIIGGALLIIDGVIGIIAFAKR